MSRRPIATVRVLDLAHLAEGCIRVEVECPASTTGITHVPGGAFEMPTPMLVTSVVYAHEERCGDCDTEAAHAQGDQEIRAATDRAWNDAQAALRRRYAEGRRN